VIGDMIHVYVMDKPSKCEDYLHLAKFAYNNGHKELLKMSPFEALYGIRYITPMSWSNPVNMIVLGPKMLKEINQEIAKNT
jgi:hypothetical protein